MNRTQSKVAKAAACILICLILAGCADKPEAAPPDEPPEDTEVAEFPAEPENGYVSMTRQLLEEKLSNDRTDCHVHSGAVEVTEDETLPDPASLPVQLATPETADTDVWLVAELPDFDIAAYYDTQQEKSWLRYGSYFQEVSGPLVDRADMVLPELHFEDFDGDEERELAVLYGGAADGGYADLSVYEWNGQKWQGCRSDVYSSVIDNDNDGGYSDDIFQFYADGTAYIAYGDDNILLDLSGFQWKEEPDSGFLDGETASYVFRDGEILQTRSGTALPYDDTVFTYTASLDYSSYGHNIYFFSGKLHSPYEVPNEFKPEQLTDRQRQVLQDFVKKCKERCLSDSSEDISQNRFAVYDINGDGQDELITELTTVGGSEKITEIYNADGSSDVGFRPVPRFYDNGIVWVPISHNQGPACAIWPFSLYDLASHREIGGARAWDREVEGFPAEADLDGDGMVYYIGDDTLEVDNPVDNDVYEAWWDSYMGGARILPVYYFHLSEDILDSLGLPVEDTEAAEPPAGKSRSVPTGVKTRMVPLRTDREIMLGAYAGVLAEMCTNFYESKAEGGVYEMLSDNRFALFDIDGDGEEELITEKATGATCEQVVTIYGFDGGVFQEFADRNSAEFYENGVIRVLTSNNHGRAVDALWPYRVYQYRTDTDTYDKIAWTSAWDRREADGADWDDVPFPTEADLDGDGIVYYILTDDCPPYADPVDGAAFEEWEKSYFNAKIEIPWQKLTLGNIHSMA